MGTPAARRETVTSRTRRNDANGLYRTNIRPARADGPNPACPDRVCRDGQRGTPRLVVIPRPGFAGRGVPPLTLTHRVGSRSVMHSDPPGRAGVSPVSAAGVAALLRALPGSPMAGVTAHGSTVLEIVAATTHRARMVEEAQLLHPDSPAREAAATGVPI